MTLRFFCTQSLKIVRKYLFITASNASIHVLIQKMRLGLYLWALIVRLHTLLHTLQIFEIHF